MEKNRRVVRNKRSATSPPEATLTSPRKQPEATLTSLSLRDLPFDLVEEILCRLSVKQLIQLRSVCKLWNSLILEDSNFAKKHLRVSTSNQGRHHLILKSTKFLNLKSPISTVFSSRDVTVSRYSLREILTKGESVRGGYVSTCDGILCYHLDNSSALLVNPSIRKFIISPPLEFPDKQLVNIFFTLAYDRFISNYKIIAFDPLSTKSVHTLVLGSGTHYWRKIQDFPGPEQLLLQKNSMLYFTCTSTGIFVSDSVNWLMTSATGLFIVSLDLAKESYQKLSLPVSNVQIRYSYLFTLGTLRGCLSILIPMIAIKENFSEVWIMKEFGNEKSWTKLLSIPYTKAWGTFRYTKVLYVSEDKVLLEMFMKSIGYRLVIYDSINNTFYFPELNKNHEDMVVASEVYVESLISHF